MPWENAMTGMIRGLKWCNVLRSPENNIYIYFDPVAVVCCSIYSLPVFKNKAYADDVERGVANLIDFKLGEHYVMQKCLQLDFDKTLTINVHDDDGYILDTIRQVKNMLLDKLMSA